MEARYSKDHSLQTDIEEVSGFYYEGTLLIRICHRFGSQDVTVVSAPGADLRGIC